VFIHFQYEALFDDNLKRLLEKKRYTDRRETSAIPIKQFLAKEGKTVDFYDTVSFRAPVHRLEAPGIERKVVDVGFIVKPKEAPQLDGAAELDVAYDGATPIQVVTTGRHRPHGIGNHGSGQEHRQGVVDQDNCAAGRLERGRGR
jgi:hypothetical protein